MHASIGRNSAEIDGSDAKERIREKERFNNESSVPTLEAGSPKD